MFERKADNECYLRKVVQKWLPGLGVRPRAQASEQTQKHPNGCLKKCSSRGFLLHDSHFPVTAVIDKESHHPSEWYFTHHPLTTHGLTYFINSSLTVYVFLDPQRKAMKWYVAESLQSYKWLYEWQYPRVLKCQKTGIFKWQKGQVPLPQSLTHMVLGLEECYIKSSLNIRSLKFIDLGYITYNMGEKLPNGMSTGHVLEALLKHKETVGANPRRGECPVRELLLQSIKLRRSFVFPW